MENFSRAQQVADVKEVISGKAGNPLPVLRKIRQKVAALKASGTAINKSFGSHIKKKTTRRWYSMARPLTGPTGFALTPELTSTLCLYLRRGNFITVACDAVGISKTTFRRWLDKGRRGESDEFIDFYHAVLSAQAEFEAMALEVIDEAGKTDWKANAWRLEHKFPSRWGQAKRRDDILIDIEREKLEIMRQYQSGTKEDEPPTIIDNVPDGDPEPAEKAELLATKKIIRRGIKND